MRLLSAWLFISLIALTARGDNTDPYAGVRFFELPNGLKVTLLSHPSATRIFVQVSVGAGHNEESESDYGVAHLVEHLLFRPQSAGEASYLDRLASEGAEVNGLTLDDQTVFYASLPAERARYLVSLFGEIFGRDGFHREIVEKAKAEVLLEYDSPDRDHDDREGDFTLTMLESQFGLQHVRPTASRVSASTRALTVKEIEAFHRRFYHPRNESLLVVGNFHDDVMRKWIADAFGALSSGTRQARVEPLPHPVKSHFELRAIANYAPRVTLGTKFWGVEPQDELVLRAYIDGLALRLMRTLRTESAQTYTVSPLFVVDTRRFGIGLVSFETTSEAFARTLAYARDLIHRETREKELGDAELREARELFAAKLRAQESDVKSLREIANNYFVFRSTYGVIGSPLSLFRQIGDDEFRSRLAALFAPEREITYVLEPPLFFSGDESWLAGIVLALALLAARFLFRRAGNERGPFRYYVRLRYTAGTWGLVAFRLLVALGIWGMACLPFLVDESPNPYLRTGYFAATLVFILAYALGQVPRRLLVKGERLVLKSLAFSSKAIPLSDIVEVSVCPTAVAMRRLHWRSALTHLSPWRPGVLILLRDGKGYFLGFDDPVTVAREVKDMLPSTNKLPAIIVPPPYVGVG